MKERLYLINYDHDYPKRGMLGHILGLKRIYSLNCYQIIFDDESEDYVCIDTLKEKGWRLVTLSELLKVGMP
jgi:hypothetical protein